MINTSVLVAIGFPKTLKYTGPDGAGVHASYYSGITPDIVLWEQDRWRTGYDG
jgi:hypothetical protein